MSAVLLASALASADPIFESPPDEPPEASLAPGEVAGADFHVQDPVHSDGLMHRYVIESRFGPFEAYGIDALAVRLHEVAALTTLSKTSETSVVVDSAVRGVETDASSMLRAATHPVGTVLGVPNGIKHLLSGASAEAQEYSASARKAVGESAKGSPATLAGHAGSAATSAAKGYADRYLGLSAAERRWYQKLSVDPYTNNEVLRRAVKRLAKIDAAASFGMRFAPIGIPFAGEVTRALDTIYKEDPAVLRKRQREALASFGLAPAEVERFQNTQLLNPTRQALLADAVKALEGVEGRAELLRHAMEVTSEVETEVFLRSAGLLVRMHAQRHVARILAGPRVPSAQLADGTVVVFGAFDAVRWTEEVAGYERELRLQLPADARCELVVSGSISPRASAELAQLGWMVHSESVTAAAAS